MKNADDEDAASISLRDINVPKKDGDWERISSVTINDITNPYYRSLVAIHNSKVEHSYSMCSSVSDDESRSFEESRNVESLAGEESCMFETMKTLPSTKVESEEQEHPLPSWKKSMLDALRDYDIGRKSSTEDEALITLKLNEAIDVGLKMVDREHERLLRRQSARVSAHEYNKSLLTIDEGLEESQSQDETDRRMSRGLSILETERSTLLAFKRGLSFDGNTADFFSWSDCCCETESGDDDVRASRGTSLLLLEEARKSFKGGVTGVIEEYSEHSVSELDVNDEVVQRASTLDSYKALLSFCMITLNDEDNAIFSIANEENSVD
jgi:hypothetical protein